jgi:hypothetical protein
MVELVETRGIFMLGLWAFGTQRARKRLAWDRRGPPRHGLCSAGVWTTKRSKGARLGAPWATTAWVMQRRPSWATTAWVVRRRPPRHECPGYRATPAKPGWGGGAWALGQGGGWAGRGGFVARQRQTGWRGGKEWGPSEVDLMPLARTELLCTKTAQVGRSAAGWFWLQALSGAHTVEYSLFDQSD